MPYEIVLKSTDPARPNEALLEEILAGQNDLADFLAVDDPEVEGASVTPLAGFPTGLETFAIVVAVTFATAFVKGVAKGAGAEIGKAVGEEAGKRIGVRIRLWIQKKFPDVVVQTVSEK